jgi:hypothetical protein
MVQVGGKSIDYLDFATVKLPAPAYKIVEALNGPWVSLRDREHGSTA